MKKIISSVPALLMQLVLLAITFALSIAGLVAEWLGAVEETGAGLFAFVIFGGVFVFCMWLSNRLVHIICYENGTVTRKGMFGGFHKEIPVNAIQNVVIRYVWREGHCIYLVDDSPRRFDSAQKDSYICFRKTKKNLAFVRTFWTEEIEENAFL